MIVLPIKRRWFDLIACGEKTEEYRDIKPYYTTRFQKAFSPTGKAVVCLRNGYSKNSPTITCCCQLTEGKGKPEWGAEPDKDYYVLKILTIYDVDK